MKKMGILILIIAMLLVLGGCSSSRADAKNNKISVVVSFNPLKEFASAIGKDKIEIKTIVPDGTEPHDFEPKARDLMNISNADVFIYNGLKMEAWAYRVGETVDNKRLVTVDASKGCDLIEYKESASTDRKYDPHIWLSIKEAKNITSNIKEALIKVDPQNKDFYKKNYTAYSSKLDEIYKEYKGRFETLKNKHFVTGHAAFGYLCRDFGLIQNSVEDMFAEGEPSANSLKALVDYCKENNIKTIFAESLVSPKVSETLANEVGARVEKIYTIESREDNRDYLESMKENLNRIYNSLRKQ